jgi:hypothetical protein
LAQAIDGITPKKESAVKKDPRKEDKDKLVTKIDLREYNNSLLSLEDLLLEPGAEEKRLIPAPSSDEVKCRQPYWLAFLRALGSILNDTQHTGGPLVKANVMNNRVIQGTDYSPKGTVDNTISTNTRFIYMFRDDAIELAVEDKCLVRGSDDPLI